MKRVLSWVVVGLGIVLLPVAAHALHMFYSVIVNFICGYIPFMEYVFDFIDDNLGDVANANIPGIIVFLAGSAASPLCIDLSSAIYPSKFGMRFFVFGCLNVTFIIAEITYLIMHKGIIIVADYVYRIGFWGAAGIIICQVIVCFVLFTNCSSLRVLFGGKYRTLFLAVAPDCVNEPKFNCVLTYCKNEAPQKLSPRILKIPEQEVRIDAVGHVPFILSTVDTEPCQQTAPMLSVGYVSDRVSLFDKKHNLRKDKFGLYVKAVRNEDAKTLKDLRIMNIFIADVTDFVIITGKAVSDSEFEYSDIFQLHIDFASRKRTITQQTYLCKLMPNALRNQTISIKNVNEVIVKS